MVSIEVLSTQLRTLTPTPSILAAAGFVLYFIATRLLRRRRPGRNTARIILWLDTAAFPGVLIGLLLSNRSANYAITDPLRQLLLSLIILTAVWLINRFLHNFFWSDHFEKRYGTPAPKILPNIVTLLLFFLAFYGILTGVFGRSLSGILVSTGVLVGVIGIALQNLISDFFYGFSITLEDLFHKGDWIELSDGTLGEVVDISWRATHLRSFNNSLYIVPNSAVSRNTVHNLSRPSLKYALWITVAVDSAYPPDLIRRLLTEATLSCTAVLTDPPPAVNFSDGTGNPYAYTIYVHFRDFVSHYRGKNDLFMAVHQRLERAGIHPATPKYAVSTEESPPRHYSRPSLQEELETTELFRPLSKEDIELLAARSYETNFPPGDTVIKEGSGETSMLIITSGVVQVLKRGSGGEEVEINRLGAGDFIGEMSLMTGKPRSATVRALVPVSGIIVPKTALEPILQSNPKLSEQIAEIMVQRKMQDTRFSRRVHESPTPTSRLLRLYMDRVGNRISDFFRIKKDS